MTLYYSVYQQLYLTSILFCYKRAIWERDTLNESACPMSKSCNSVVVVCYSLLRVLYLFLYCTHIRLLFSLLELLYICLTMASHNFLKGIGLFFVKRYGDLLVLLVISLGMKRVHGQQNNHCVFFSGHIYLCFIWIELCSTCSFCPYES